MRNCKTCVWCRKGYCVNVPAIIALNLLDDESWKVIKEFGCSEWSGEIESL